MLQTLQMSKSRRRAGVHLENMTDPLVSHARAELLIEEKIVTIGILRAVGFVLPVQKMTSHDQIRPRGLRGRGRSEI